MRIALFALGASMVVATALPLLRSDRWWIRIFDFPRIQITALIVLALALHPLFAGSYNSSDYLLLASLAACLAYQCFMMFPYTPLARRQVQSSRGAREGHGLSLLFANVLMDNRNAERLKELIREADPDIILTVETDGWWEERLREFERTHPHAVRRPQGNTYGMLLYSKLELVGPEVKFLVQDDIPSIHARVRLPGGREVGLHCLHPRPPFPTEDDSATERDAELLIVGRSIKEEEAVPVVVLGDLNDVAWSRTNYLFKDISGLLDPRVGRGFYNTFHAKYPFIRFPLDHFFHSNHFRLVDFRRLPYFGSDHFPVFISLSYEPEAEAEQPELQATPSEQREASEKIEKAS
ncbi:MAG TPA: endonuclease/exonuclease/phosphatase family protein [Pyrinomonadaceae bacterium]|nr:endonuclease/exonuclease/phosphatase family protein [Pyrinomonadaceae bacterium]